MIFVFAISKHIVEPNTVTRYYSSSVLFGPQNENTLNQYIDCHILLLNLRYASITVFAEFQTRSADENSFQKKVMSLHVKVTG